MKYNFLIIISTLLLCVSCTRNVDLKEVFEERIVIEGNISKDSIGTVRISKTVNSTEPDVFPMVENAEVILKIETGEEEILTETEAGIYQTATLKGVEGLTYELMANVDDSDYNAATKILPLTIELLELIIIKSEDTSGVCSYQLSVDFTKNTADSLYCLFYIYRNASKIPTTVFYKNEIASIQNLSQNLYTFGSLVAGEVIKVEAVQMEKWQYDYLQSLQNNNDTETISGLLIGPPDNLQGNLSGEALGYFGGTNRTCLELTIP